MKIKIVIFQHNLSASIDEGDYEIIKSYNSDFVCLPEYFFHYAKISCEDALIYMKKISLDLNCCLIGGTAVLEEQGRLYNTCFIFNKGKQVGHYKKINLFEKEIGKITPGDNDYKVFNINGIRTGILICADVLNGASWKALSLLKPALIFVPTLSPYKEESETQKFRRDEEIFVNGAGLTGSIVIKTCSIGDIGGYKLQGRSLAADKKGIIWRVEPCNEDKPVIKMISVDI